MNKDPLVPRALLDQEDNQVLQESQGLEVLVPRGPLVPQDHLDSLLLESQACQVYQESQERED